MKKRVGTMLMTGAALILGALCLFIPRSVAQKKPEPVKSNRIYVFDLGALKTHDPKDSGFTPDQLASTYLSVVGYLIVNPKGTLEWDSGVVRDDQVGTDAPHADRAGITTSETS